MKLDRVLETCLYADDLVAAERFYADALGLKVHARVEGRHVFFKLESGMFLVFAPDATDVEGPLPRHGARGAGHAAFAVGEAELPAWRERLAERGVAIEKEIEWPGGAKSIYFRDPAGNSLELATPKLWGYDPA